MNQERLTAHIDSALRAQLTPILTGSAGDLNTFCTRIANGAAAAIWRNHVDVTALVADAITFAHDGELIPFDEEDPPAEIDTAQIEAAIGCAIACAHAGYEAARQ